MNGSGGPFHGAPATVTPILSRASAYSRSLALSSGQAAQVTSVTRISQPPPVRAW